MARAHYILFMSNGIGEKTYQCTKERLLEALQHDPIRNSMREEIDKLNERVLYLKSLLEESKP